MILENMTASEKMAQMNKVTPLIVERVDAFLDRNNSLVKKQFKTKSHIEFNRPFRFTEYGEWDVFIFLTKISSKWAKIGIHAYQKYYVKYAKSVAKYENKAFYQFVLNAFIKKALKENIKEGKIDTIYGKGNTIY